MIKIFALLIIVLVAIFALLYVTHSPILQSILPNTIVQNTQTQDLDVKEEVEDTVDVTANNNSLDPSTFEMTHFKATILRINAVDRDYTFNMPDFNINTTIPKGQTMDVKISGLGVGTYNYSCGTNCGGSVKINDEEDVESDEQ